MVPPWCQRHRCTQLLVQGAHTPVRGQLHTQGRSAHRLSPSLACHEETIIQLEPRVKNTQETAMIRASSFPQSAWCFGDRETETGPHFRHVMTRPPQGATGGGGKGSHRAQNSGCAGEGGARVQASLMDTGHLARRAA